MKEPIKVGDLAIVIEGALGEKSPNVGKIVQVRSFRGDHMLYGKIWRCSGTGLVGIDGTTKDELDFPATWLRKINPPSKDDVVEYKKRKYGMVEL